MYIDIRYTDRKPVIQIEGATTRFLGARSTLKVTAEALWEAIITCRYTVYTGLPHFVRAGKGTQFRNIFAELAAIHDTDNETVVSNCRTLSV